MTQLNESQLYAMIQSLQIDDPVLKDLFREFVKRQQIVFNELFEEISLPPAQENFPIETVVGDVLVFNYELLSQGIHLTWESPSLNAILYEIREGNSWEDSTRVIVSSTLSAVIAGRETGETHKFWIKAQALDGTQSKNAKELDIIIPAISTPQVTSNVVDNFVLLSWPPVDSAFQIDYYIFTRDGEEVGQIRSTFVTFFELTSGEYTYGFTAVDIFGNKSEEGTRVASVAQPSDYELTEHLLDDFTGTRESVYRDALDPSIFAIINLTQTWGQYAANGYDSMQDEINAGFPYWLQPTDNPGQYTRIFDFGMVYHNLVVTVDYNKRVITPDVSVQFFMQTSTDGTTWTEELETESRFVVAVRYARVRILFTSLVLGKGYIEIYNLRIRLDVRLELDAGRIYSLASNNATGGTYVAFNKKFKDVRSITVSAESASNVNVSYNWQDIPDPLGFYVSVWLDNGQPTNCWVSWKAQGVS